MTARVRRAEARDEAPVVALLASEGLEAEFVPAEFAVAEHEGRVVACARLKPLGDGAWEIASVAVDPVLRGHGLGRLVVGFALREAQGRVYALALEPGFFGRLGFLRLPEPPEPLREKAEGLCASSGFVPMLLSPSLVPRAGGEASS